jgi:hypothetical protein
VTKNANTVEQPKRKSTAACRMATVYRRKFRKFLGNTLNRTPPVWISRCVFPDRFLSRHSDSHSTLLHAQQPTGKVHLVILFQQVSFMPQAEYALFLIG